VIGVVGASARAAVMTLARAGESCWAIDLFNDRDLRRLAPCVRCPLEHFPQAIPELAKQFPPGPVLCTGGLENHPDVIAELLRSRELLGPDPDVVRRVRDPFNLVGRPLTLPAGSVVPERSPPLRGGGGRLFESNPETLLGFSADSGSPRHGVADYDGGWLLKSLRSSGGLGVRWAKPGEAVPEGHVAQQFIHGTPMSAVFQDEMLLGITGQLVGIPWLHAKPFHYAGTIAGAEHNEPPGSSRREFDRLRMHIVSSIGCSLRGFHGVDFILHDGTPYILEINPRYPASVECIEFANHLRCTVGKAIWFAPHAFRFPDSGPWDDDLAGAFDPWRLPNFADIPEADEPFEAGNPVITFFATGRNAEECRERLQSRAAELDRLFARTLP
jgi:predicted ATP-grasp superfamily ATP-dependent carboligase